MSMIPLNLKDVQESKPVPAGRYDLTISSAEEGLTKEKKKPQIVVYIGIDGHVDAPNVRHNVSLPAPEDEPKTKQFKMILLKRFLELFKIPYTDSGFNIEDFVGARASAELALTEPNDTGDVYNELIVPRMKGEAEQERGKVVRPASVKKA